MAAQVAAKGVPATVVYEVSALSPSLPLRCMVVDSEHLDAAMAALPSFPGARLLVLCDQLSPPVLAAALRQPQLVGLVADSYDGPDLGMVAYAVRRALSTPDAVPLTQLFDWAHTQVAFTVHGVRDRQRVMESVSAIAARFGLSSTLARTAQEATGHLLDVSMAGAVPPSSEPQHASNVASTPERAIRVQVVLDASRLGVEVTEPFGTLTRSDVFGGLLQAVQQPDAHTSGQALHRVASSVSMLRFHSQAKVATRMAFVMPRTAALRQPMGTLLWEQHQAGASPVPTPRLAAYRS